MNDSYADKIKHLCELVEANGLPDSDREVLVKHLDQLDRPMNVAIFGTDCIRVASVVNFLVAKRILPTEGRPDLPIRLQYAETEIVQAKLNTGETKRYEWEEIPSVLDAARHVTIGAPLPALRKISIVQFVHAEMEELCVAARKSASATDLTFLCADRFGSEEERFWMSLPEKARDRGYLLAPASADVPSRAGQILAGVILADIEAATKLREAPGGLDRTAFKNAGGMDLVSTIRRELDWSEQAVFDAATVLIHRAINPKPGAKDAARRTARDENVTKPQVIEAREDPRDEAREERAAPEAEQEVRTSVAKASDETRVSSRPDADDRVAMKASEDSNGGAAIQLSRAPDTDTAPRVQNTAR